MFMWVLTGLRVKEGEEGGVPPNCHLSLSF